MELKTVKVSTLRAHPENYNTHPEEQLVELEKSLDQFSQFKNIVVNPDNVVLAGHGLVEAAKRKGIETLDAYIFVGTTEQEKALLLADNATPFLALPDMDKLNDLFASLPSFDDIPGITDTWLESMYISRGGEEDTSKYTKIVEAPIYEPIHEKPKLTDVYNIEKYQKLIQEIIVSSITEEEKKFLQLAATRHIVFHYEKIADYYAHSGQQIQVLFENSSLVIIDFEKALELGYIQISEEIADQFLQDYPHEKK